ncbi:anti-anti-sigma factor [Motilibacter peucedani]|uniref:Anti-anti-sigma factor n=1 Tax=Motilibacter peucedani TaxID=598650 RepID=A0A420XRC8_9ACTN|nr:STAS domain-containing protein [Motilibacter peucedani]RKS77414.1 anti-anti-sigma factor [Motilibacter peucedani]
MDLSNWWAEHEPGRTTVAVTGEIDLESGPRLREFLASELTQLHAGLLLLDTGGVTFCDSSGLQAFVATLRRAKLLGIELVLQVEDGSRFARFLELAGVADLFTLEPIRTSG